MITLAQLLAIPLDCKEIEEYISSELAAARKLGYKSCSINLSKFGTALRIPAIEQLHENGFTVKERTDFSPLITVSWESKK